MERDDEAFGIVDYDPNAPQLWDPETTGLPVINIHEQYTGTQATYGNEVGTNYGCKAHLPNR